jgi:hypothetical protein
MRRRIHALTTLSSVPYIASAPEDAIEVSYRLREPER